MKNAQKTRWFPYLLTTAGVVALFTTLIVKNLPQLTGQKPFFSGKKEPVVTPIFLLSKQVEQLQSEIAALSTKATSDVDSLQAQVDALSAKTNSPDLSTKTTSDVDNLQAQIDALSSKTNSPVGENICCEEEEFASHVPNQGFRANIDFLYWKAIEDGLEYGTKMTAGPLIGQPSQATTKLLDLHFEWDPGFRLGAGYIFNCFDQWAVDASWTHIRNHAHGKASALGIESQVGNVNTIIPPWVTQLFELRLGASEASAHWHVDFNTVDLSLSRSFCASRRLRLSPYIGFRGAWIDQHYQAKYNSVFLLGENRPLFTRVVTFTGKNDFRGFGMRGGSELMWYLGCHWKLFAQLSGSLLYGKFKVKMKNLNDQGLGEGQIPPMPLDFSAAENFWRVRLNFEEAIGLGWETFFACERYHLSFTVAYELSQWLNQNELFYTFYFRGQDTISSIPIRSQGNLGFQGVRAGVQFSF